MSLQADFEQALERLRHWHSDSTKAQNFDGPSISHTKPGAVELRLQTYPHESYWWGRWRLAKGEVGRREVVEELEQEYWSLGHSPSKKYLYWREEAALKLAIAKDERPAKNVAREYAVSERTVYRYRKQFGRAAGERPSSLARASAPRSS